MLKLLRFLRPYTGLVLLVLTLTSFQAISQLYLPTLMADIVDIGIVQGDVSYILRTGGWMLSIALVGSACMILAGFFSSKAGVGFGRDIRGSIFRRVERFSLQEFDTVGTASLITRTTNDVTQIQQVTVVILRMMVMAPIMAVGGVVMAVSKDARLALVFVVSLPLLSAFILFVAAKGIPLFHSMQKKLDRLNKVLRERLSGIRVVRAFNRSEYEQARYEKANRDMTETAIKVNRIMASAFPVLMLMMNLTAVALVWFGAVRIDSGAMQVGDLMAFIQYAMQIMFSLLIAAMMIVMIPRGSASAKRVNEVLEMRPTIDDPESPRETGRRSGFVEFDNVTFAYPGAEEPAVRNVTFKAAPGEITAIVGGTGSGKTTLVNLIPRFYDVDSGRVLVDGVDVRELTQEDLRRRIGYVPQQAVLFSGSVKDNLRYGKRDANAEELRRALSIAQADEFVDAMSDGLETQISQAGANVSGGQKQRLSIARALVRRPEIYIFDDSFSALDFKTDAKLRATLRKELSEATVLIVAQRVATIMRADRIVVLEEGVVRGIGTHAELMEACEVYRQIVLSQLSMEEIA